MTTPITMIKTTDALITIGCNGRERGEDGYSGYGGTATFRVALKQADGRYAPVAKCHDAEDGTRWARRQMKRNGGGEYVVVRGRKVFWMTADDASR